MPDVVISYSRRDEEFVDWLQEKLSSEGRDVWLDRRGLRPREEWLPAIFGAIDAAHAVIVIISPDYLRSRVCRDELDHAIQSNKRLVPVACPLG